MAQIINQDSIGKKFGTGLGSSFASGFESLVQNKLQRMQEHAEADKNVQYLIARGYSPQDAAAVVHSKPHIGSGILKEIRDSKTAANEQAEYNRLTGGATGQTKPGAQLEGATTPGGFSPPQNMAKGDALKYAKFTQKERDQNLKRYKNDIESVRDKGIAAETKLDVYNKLKELNKKELTAGPFGTLTEDGKLYESLLAQILPKPKSKYEAESIAKGYPTLEQSAKNRQMLIDRAIEQSQPELLEAQIAADILDENDGYPPKDFDKQFKRRVHEAKKKARIEPSEGPNAGVFDELSSSKNQQIPSQSAQPEQQQAELIQDMQGIQPQSAEGEAAPWTQENLLESNPDISALEGLKYLGGRAVKGGVQGLTGAATLAPNLYRAYTGNEVPGLETANKLGQYIAEGLGLNSENAPTEALETIGNIGENAASMLGLGGAFGAAAKGANAISKGAKLTQWTNNAARILGTTPQAALKVAGVQEAGKWMGKKIGFGEAGQAATSIGATILASSLGSRGLPLLINNLEKESSKLMGQIKPVSSPSLTSAIDNALNKLSNTKIQTPTASNVFKDLHDEVKRKAFSGQDLITLKDKVNGALAKPGLNVPTRQALSDLLTTTEDIFTKATAGTKVGELLNDITDLKNAHTITNRVAKWAQQNLFKRPLKKINTILLGSFAKKYLPKEIGSSLTSPKVIATIGGAASMVGEMDRIMRMSMVSPTFRKYYGDFMTAVAHSNLKDANKFLSATDKTLDKYYPEFKNK